MADTKTPTKESIAAQAHEACNLPANKPGPDLSKTAIGCFRISPSPPHLYEKALIIQGFVVSGVWKNLPAHTSAHTLCRSELARDGR